MTPNNDQWKLKSLSITFMEYGDYKGKYVGKIQFENREQEAFMFNMRQEMVDDYLKLISKEVALSAGHLGQRIMESLNLLPDGSVKTLQIESK